MLNNSFKSLFALLSAMSTVKDELGIEIAII